MKKTYQSPLVEVVTTDLRYTLLQESDTKMIINTDVIIEGQIEDGDKLVNFNNFWDEEEEDE